MGANLFVLIKDFEVLGIWTRIERVQKDTADMGSGRVGGRRSLDWGGALVAEGGVLCWVMIEQP